MESTIAQRQDSIESDSQPRAAAPRMKRRGGVSLEGRIVLWLFFGCALVSIVTTIGIIFTLVSQAIGFFFEVSLWEFLTGTRWTPILKPRAYGVLPLVGGTLLIATIAALVALPVGLAAAIFLSEYAPNKVRRIVKPMLGILAPTPTHILACANYDYGHESNGSTYLSVNTPVMAQAWA